jgi:hypothetical protein
MGRERETVSSGDAFLVANPYNHLYIAISETDQNQNQILLVSLTTFKPKEETCCMVNKGDHPFVQHRSCIRYKDARAASASDLIKLLKAGKMTRHEPVSEELLARIRAGAFQSEYLPEEFRRLLLKQGLIQDSPS